MTEALPEGWLQIPYGIDPAHAGEAATELTRAAAETFPGFTDGDEAREATVAAITRPPVTEQIVGRVWHVLGPEATGVFADLSVAKGVDVAPDSPFPFCIVQKTISFDGGRAVLSFTAPREHVPAALLLRVQRAEVSRTLIADVIGPHPALMDRVIDDLIRIVGGTP